jgi:general secretion pathway protein K
MGSRRAQAGVALVTAVLIVAIAVAVTAQISFGHQIWFRQMENVQDRGATDWLRRGALHWASTALIEDAAQSKIDHLGERWAMGLPPLPVDGGSISATIVDAQSRFNLNSVGNTDPASEGNLLVLQRLLESLQLNPSLANAVADWIDADSDVRPGGAEDIDYLNMNPPYRAANRMFASVDELRLVRGFDAKTFAAVLPYVTVLPVTTDNINVNTASPEVIAALVPGLDVAAAKAIIDGRDGHPMTDLPDFQKRLPQGLAFPKSGPTVSSDYFLVTLNTSIGRYQRRSEALLQRTSGGSGTNILWERAQPLIAPPDEQSEKTE